MYDRRLDDGRVLRLGHAGMLVMNSFVFYDHQTQSLWIHVTGKAFHGPLEGQRLRFLPSTVATWAQWKAAHPHTTVLPGRRSGSFMGEYDGLKTTRLLGLAVVHQGHPRLYPFPLLIHERVRNDVHNGIPLVTAYDPSAAIAVAWGRTVQGRALTFEPAPATAAGSAMRDVQTGSTWQALTGRAVSGPLRGQELPAIPSHPILIDRFRAFYPGAPVAGEADAH